ncbi:type 1 glutamine amidotransferase domain-containing protein [Denitrobaculum tricleocarpae]|uniref:Type 1 glutamine amidotransferase domain-containing protein n=1 Tax=Denitrobaculum tricleocarpae TaxID=2591009 RepID=A0A545TYB9_9PROT|nr:type 1 glutamine amidotransferase domain-containing protein [Denitrobaculum tricleocarpae]TQV82197.1 type 1 glutamine amidotransferase domain-containing protein [Denitrobaculum tricleocarpae]
MQNILIVLTSHTTMGDTNKPTGFYFEEMAAPYWAMVDAGHEVTIASIKGGAAVHDPSSLDPDPTKRPAPVERFIEDATAMARLADTPAITDIDPMDYDAIFLPGGHGTVWDLPDSAALAGAVGRIYDAGGVVAAVCHGPAGLVNARRADGRPLVEGRRVNSFTDSEEEAVGLTDVVPFLLETRLRELGAIFEAGENFTPHAVRDGRLITGQNPQSSDAVGAHLIEALADANAKARAS